MRNGLCRLSPQETRELRNGQMARDFPAAELKTAQRLAELIEGGAYAAYGWFDDGAMAAYALLASDEETVLLDYLAVNAERGKGYGSRMLRALQTHFGAKNAMLGEVEDPDAATGDRRALRERRIAFYQKNGWRPTGIRVGQYGETLRVMCRDLARRPTDAELVAALDAYYRKIYRADYSDGKVAIADAVRYIP